MSDLGGFISIYLQKCHKMLIIMFSLVYTHGKGAEAAGDHVSTEAPNRLFCLFYVF